VKINYILIVLVIILVGGYIISAQFRFNNRESGHKKDPAKEYERNNHVILRKIPDSVIFAGESIRLDDPDLVERYDREIVLNTHFHSNTIMLLKKSHKWFPLFEPILERYGIPDDFKYLTLVEGALTNDVSPRGAVGFWQLLPSTARELGLEVSQDVDERYSPIKSTEAACKYILRAKEKFGTWTNAAASYNIGMRGLARNMERQKVESYYDLLLNEETSRYIFRIIALKKIFEAPEEYGFLIERDQYYIAEPVDSVTITYRINDLTEFAFSRGINYKILKRHNPWLRKNTLSIKRNRKKYVVVIPKSHQKSTQSQITISDSLMIGEDRIDDQEME
jgi:hypothetical protein